MDAIPIARGGMTLAERRFEAAASRIAQAPGDASIDVGRELVETIKARHQHSANLNVVRVACEMWRSLLELQVR